MTKQEQINTLIDRLEKLESEYTRLHEEQRRDVLDNIERYGKTIQLFDKHNRDIDRLNTIVERLKSQQQEIERLKAENEELTKVVSSKVYDLIDNAKEIADAREAWEKQAKIDVLNELTVKAVSLSAIETYHICNLVDELIKEIEK